MDLTLLRINQNLSIPLSLVLKKQNFNLNFRAVSVLVCYEAVAISRIAAGAEGIGQGQAHML